MGRWRPPAVQGSKYITPEGARKLTEEVQYLWTVERPDVTDRVAKAAAQGDRSENAEYIYGKKRLREIDSRLRFLTNRLDGMSVVDRIPEDQDKVYFGAFVTLEDEDGEEVEYRIVGPDEFNVADGKISMDSPLGKAILGKRVNDEIKFSSPKGMNVLYISKIRYLEKE
ncbi:transcription elongation factor GreB [Desulfoluna limicola]|uniref:Transcription elongation factor GreB n=1 Tax=Desulfoluna limicola TaxID=2810562 RepID=A0ABM7PGE7_9BACT|nr:transcription elongation factor GreB [Desulfoluna limicola]BCS96207.1 transcription elongation factor GreB [Desulfoluna limicola]